MLAWTRLSWASMPERSCSMPAPSNGIMTGRGGTADRTGWMSSSKATLPRRDSSMVAAPAQTASCRQAGEEEKEGEGV